MQYRRKNPGVYDIVNSPRAQTAIAKAGGLTHEADTIKLNLAQKLSDGQMLYVPVIGEVASNKVTVDQQGAESGQEMTKINLNTATAEELQTLEGVGEKKAEQIIAYREAHDGFKKLDEIKEVSGIGAKRFETMQDKITI
ncbi:helix-hairpin-helix domain-containing protein [Leuconostoc gelidum]|uniref:helix-hairpin-helix domain-containing protein n=1 Tax=Leuconostoc gelidum TaxID=1244 RepID=UPI001CC5A9AB|nr:helix-hairpin-helix domain-containing protein [Leuconostoc gelidum]